MRASYYWMGIFFLKIIANICREVVFKPVVSLPCLILNGDINFTEIVVGFYLLEALQVVSPQFSAQTRYHLHVVTAHQKFHFKLKSIFKSSVSKRQS